jgi:cell division protein FtsB
MCGCGMMGFIPRPPRIPLGNKSHQNNRPYMHNAILTISLIASILAFAYACWSHDDLGKQIRIIWQELPNQTEQRLIALENFRIDVQCQIQDLHDSVDTETIDMDEVIHSVGGVIGR